MGKRALERRLRRTLVEAAYASEDEQSFRRLLSFWAETDAGLRAALSDPALFGRVITNLITILESATPLKSSTTAVDVMTTQDVPEDDFEYVEPRKVSRGLH